MGFLFWDRWGPFIINRWTLQGKRRDRSTTNIGGETFILNWWTLEGKRRDRSTTNIGGETFILNHWTLEGKRRDRSTTNIGGETWSHGGVSFLMFFLHWLIDG